ncbi:MAG: MFS transporter, partial [Atribacterota bacterium]
PVLTALLLIAFGLSFLETAANPDFSVLFPRETAERTLNLSQSFNGLGWIFVPLAGGLIFFGMQSAEGNQFETLWWPYLGVGFVVLIVAFLFLRTPLPEIREEAQGGPVRTTFRELFKYRHFILAVVAQFFYVAAQTGINSFFINYVTESIPISNRDAALVLSFGGMGMF